MSKSQYLVPSQATIILPIGQCSRSITRQNQENGNCLAILIFAWSYILSARWVEMQQTSGKFAAQSNDRMVYLCDQVGWRDDTSESLLGTIDVNLGDACIDAVRWWAAILAKGEGWRAEIERNGNVYRSPWSTTSNSADHQFRLTRASTSQSSFDSVLSPPSSEVALGYLTDFCLHHNAGGQCSAALASALTFPSLTAASLPLPSSHGSYLRTQEATADVSSPPRSSLSSPSGHVDEKDEILRDLSYCLTI